MQQLHFQPEIRVIQISQMQQLQITWKDCVENLASVIVANFNIPTMKTALPTVACQ